MKTKTILILTILTLLLLIPSVSAIEDKEIQKVADTSITVSSTQDLQNALDNQEYNKIILKNGTYKLNGTTVTRDLTIESESNEIITIDGGNIQHIFYIPENYKLTLNNIKVFNGNGYQSTDNFGGGIIVDGTLIANNCIFDSNYVGSRGGGVLIEGGQANFTNCIFNDNQAGHGGAIATFYYEGYVPIVYIKNCTFTKNYATYGGAIHIMGGYLYVEDSTFEENTALNYGSSIHVNKGFDQNGVQYIAYALIKNTKFINNNVHISGEYGGAVSLFGKVDNDIVTVDVIDSYFEKNTAEYGGALCVLIDGFLNVSNSIFKSNSATSYGGAIYVFDNANINNCTFQSNTGRQGGAVSIYVGATITNSIFQDNTATLSGGAIRSDGDTYINNSHFTSNTAPYGGAISAEGKQGWFSTNKLILENSILTGNNAIELTNNSGGIGGGIYIEGGCDIINSIIEDNNAYYDGGGICINNYNNTVKINNNIILNNRANQEGTQVEIEDLNNVNINNNWWGLNNPFTQNQNLVKLYDNQSETYSQYTPETWINLKIDLTKDKLNPAETTNLKATITNNNNENTYIPKREIKFLTNGGILNPTTTEIETTTNTEYTAPLTTGIYNIQTTLDNEEQTIAISVGETETVIETIIQESQIEINPEDRITIHITAGNYTINSGTIRLYNNGVNIGTNTVQNGISQIQNQLTPGTYTINAYYIGEGIYANTNKTITLIIKNNTTPETPTNTTNNTNTTPETPTNITNTTNKSTIITTNLQTGTYGEEIIYTGELHDEYGNPLMGHPVYLNITRLSSGANKVYRVITDYTGTYRIPITLAPGTYTIKTSYTGINGNKDAEDQLTSLIIYRQDETPSEKTVSTIKLNTFSTSERKLTGQLIDNYANPIIGYYVNIKITRLSSGANKVYRVTTDYTGGFTLPINLANGQYLIECTFDGTDIYTTASNTKTIEL